MRPSTLDWLLVVRQDEALAALLSQNPPRHRILDRIDFAIAAVEARVAIAKGKK